MKRSNKESFEEYKKRRKNARITVKKKLKGILVYNSSLVNKFGKGRPYRKVKKPTA